ncbi:hypothetical protein [Pseudomonas sp. FEN]|nr:hypothetical protein [Pseudomonas sp. FEN]
MDSGSSGQSGILRQEKNREQLEVGFDSHSAGKDFQDSAC